MDPKTHPSIEYSEHGMCTAGVSLTLPVPGDMTWVSACHLEQPELEEDQDAPLALPQVHSSL